MTITHIRAHPTYGAPFPITPEGIETLLSQSHELIAKGGMGCVWSVEHDGKTIALKEMIRIGRTPHRPRSWWYLNREAALLTSMTHPNIVKLYARWRTDGDPMYAMEYMRYDATELSDNGAVKFGSALYIVREIAKALAFLHKRGVVHADVKPDNILMDHLFDENALPKVSLCDFALAHRVGRRLMRVQKDNLIGTPGYMDKDVLRGRPYSRRSDVYALGCVFHQLLSVDEDYVGKTPSESFNDQASGALQKRLLNDATLPVSAKIFLKMVMGSHAISNGASLVTYIDQNYPMIRHAKTVGDLRL